MKIVSVIALLGLSVFSVGAQTPPQQYLYIAEQNSHTIDGFAINGTTGALTAVLNSPFREQGDPVALVSNSTGTFLFVANQMADSVSVFTISSVGSLQEIAGSPFVITDAIQPSALAISSDGKFLFVASQFSNANPNAGELDSFSISANGTLTPVNRVPAPILSLGVSVTATNAYVLGSDALQAYSINQGVLTATNLLSLAGTSPAALLGTSSFLFVAWNDAYGHNDSYGIQQDGTLSLVSSFNNQQLFNTISNLAFSGNFLYTNQGTYSVANGVLTFTGLNWINPSPPAPLTASPTQPFLFEGSEAQSQPPLVYPLLIAKDGSVTNSEPPLVINGVPTSLVVASTASIPPTNPAFVFEPASLNFNPVSVGQTLTGQVQVISTGSSPLTINSISISGSADFSETNTCPASLPPVAICPISVTFAPSAPGNFTASLNLVGNVNGSVPLSGDPSGPPPPDFSLSATPSSMSITAGQTVTSQINVTPLNGFNGQVQFTCADSAPLSTCAVSSAGQINVSTTNTASLLPIAILLIIGIGTTRLKARKKTALVFASLIILGACGGGSTGTKPPPVVPQRTPNGNYSIVITGTSGSLTHQTSVALTVQ